MRPSSTRSIVVVDDSVHDYETYVHILKRSPRKYTTKYMSLGKQFLASASDRPDCVLLDLSLPDATGLEIIKTLKEGHHGTLPFPIVMVTGSGDEHTGEEAIEMGAQDYLVKEDLTPSSLRRSIEFAMTRFKLEKRVRESEAKHRAAVASLKASEERFRAIFEHARTGIVIEEQAGKIIQFNASFAEMLGYSTDELEGKNFADLIHPEDRESNLQEVRRLQAGEISYFAVENRYVHKSGKPVYVHKFVSVLDSQSGGVPLFMALVTDISARKRAEERLQERSRQLDLLARTSQALLMAQHAPDKILKQVFEEIAQLVDAEIFFHYRFTPESGTLKLINFGGFEKKQMEPFETLQLGDLLCGRVAQTRTRLIVQDMQKSGQPGCEVLSAAGAKSYIGFPLLTNDRLLGTLSFTSLRRTHFREDEINTLQSLCDQIATALERSRLMHEVQESEKRFRLFIENAPAAIAMFDGQMRYLAVSNRFLRDYGINRDVIGRSHYDVFPETPDRWKQVHKRALRGEVINSNEDWFLRKDGREQYLKWEVRPWHDDQGVGGILLCTEDISDRVRAENAVRESEKRLTLVVDSADVGTWDWDIRKNEVVWSKQCKQLFGLPESTMMSYDRFLQTVHPDDREEIAHQVDSSLHDKSDHKVEMRTVWPDGSLHWIASRGRATYDVSGKPIRMSGVAFDITQRKFAEEALRASEEQNRILAGQMNQAAMAAELGFWSWEIASGEISPDQNNRAMLGLPLKGQVTFADFVSKIHPQDRANLQSEIEASLRTGVPYDAEFRVRSDGSSVRWIGARGAVASDSSGNITGMRGIAIDITRRKEMAETLRRSEARLRLALDAAQMSVWAWDLKSDAVAWSQNLEPQLAMKAGSFRGTYQSFLDLVHPEDRDRVMAAIQRSIAHGDEYRIEFRMRKADGGIRWTETRGVVRRDDSGVPVEFSGVDVDITERKKIEQELSDLNKNLESLVEKRTKELADTLGELQTEVATRKIAEEGLRDLSIRLLRMQDEERRRIARELHDSTGQTLSALKMSLARVQGDMKGDASAERSLAESNLLVDEALAEIRTISHLLHPPLLDEVGFVSAAKWYVEGFERRSGIAVALQLADIKISRSASLALFRVLQESLTNVIRHSEAKAVKVQLTSSVDHVVLHVKDFGKGIPGERIATFMQTGAGVGVGLVGMRERLKELGGSLEIKSEGVGTEVIATLPPHLRDGLTAESKFSAA